MPQTVHVTLMNVFCLDDLKIARERLVSKEEEMAKTIGMHCRHTMSYCLAGLEDTCTFEIHNITHI